MLTVNESSLVHENHATDEVTYNHYSENLRIPPEKLQEVEKMISLGANKQKIKANLMQEENRIVSLKTLHNIQSKLRHQNQHKYDGNDELQKIFQKLQEIPNATVRVVTSDQNELIGMWHIVYF